MRPMDLRVRKAGSNLITCALFILSGRRTLAWCMLAP